MSCSVKLVAIALIASTLFSALRPSMASSLSQQPPPFTLFDTAGKYVSLSDYKGQVVILNFWAFWCDTWKQELPSLTDLYSDEKQDHFRLLAISIDGTRVPVFERDTSGQKIPFPVLLDTGSNVSRSYGVRHVPTVVILDKEGKVRYSAYGYPGNHVLISELRKIESAGAQNWSIGHITIPL